MALKTFVKISNVSNLSDARYCAGMMVDVLGFNIDSTSDSFVSEGDFGEITDWVAGVKFAGEFYDANVDQIKEALKLYAVDFIEIDKMDMVEPTNLLGKSIIFRLNVNTTNDLDNIKANLSYLDELVSIVLIRSTNEELHEELDNQICFYNGNLKLLKGYGIQINDTIAKFPGLEMEAKEEERPGYKDYGQIMDVLEVLDED